MNRTSNIRYRSNYMRETNHLVFRQIKNQREENEKNIKIEYERELKIKNSKRNKVRMIEIECKENINKFWIKKLTNFKDVREKEIARNLQNEERKM